EADHRTYPRHQHALRNEIAVHHRIEERIVMDVVDMAVDVVVHPSRRDDMKVGIAGAQFGQRSIGHALPALSPVGNSRVPSASARRRLAEPGASGFCWLSCGAQPESQAISKVARMRPSASAKRSP